MLRLGEKQAGIVAVRGKYAEIIRQEFGEIQFGTLGIRNEELFFHANTALANIYRKFGATVEGAPLYILVPNHPIQVLWPEGVGDEVKFGTAFTGPNGKREELTTAVGVFKGITGVYICLKPLTDREASLLEEGCLGM